MKEKSMKKTLGLAIMAGFMSSTLYAQLPEIKGAEAQLNQVPANIIGAKKSIDEAASISGAEALPYFWLIQSSTYNALGSSSKYRDDNPDAAEKALISLNKYYQTVVGNTKAERRYGDAANSLIPAVVVNSWNKAIVYRRDDSTTKEMSAKKADMLYKEIAVLLKYDDENDEIMKNTEGYSSITYNETLKNAYQNAYFGMKDYNLARTYINQLINNKYNDPNLYVFMSRTYEEEGNEEKQLETLKNGRQAYPDSKEIIAEEINYYIANDKLIILKEAIDKEIATGNASSTYYYIRGYVNDQIGTGQLTKDGKTQEGGTMDTAYMYKAKTDYLKAIELDPNNLNAIFNLGTVYTNLGNYWNKKASNLPYSATELYGKYTGYQNDNFKNAIEYYEKAKGFSGAQALSKAEKLNMLFDLKQLYAKTKNMAKVKEINEEISALKAAK